MTYDMFLDYEDLYICRFKVKSDDWLSIYKEVSENFIRDAFRKNVTIPKQIQMCRSFCDSIKKRKEDCYKVRASDYLMFMTCYLVLVKYKQIKDSDIIFLRRKRKSRISGRG